MGTRLLVCVCFYHKAVLRLDHLALSITCLAVTKKVIMGDFLYIFSNVIIRKECMNTFEGTRPNAALFKRRKINRIQNIVTTMDTDISFLRKIPSRNSP